jgi:LPXTG-motif cell wall-anchored protein
MDKKLSHRIYHSSLIGLLSTSVLLSLSAGNVTASANINQPVSVSTALTSQAHSDDQLITKDVVRTINYVNPLTNEKHVIRQVASFQLDQDGKLVKTIHPGWQAYVLPCPEGYIPLWVEIPPKVVTPDSTDEVEEATYTKLIKEPRTTSSVLIEFDAIDGSPIIDRVTTISKPHNEPVVTFTLPSPPEGWEYVEKDQLPKVIQTIPNSGIRYKFLVQRIQAPGHQESRVENKQLCRTITLHLPTGDRVITQHALATRNVSVVGDKTHYGEWQISPFDEFQLPKVDGYQASLDKVVAQQLTVDQLAQDSIAVEVDYHKVIDDKGTGTGTTDDSTVTDPTPSGNKGSQTDDPTMSDSSTQTDQSTSTGTQTEQPATDDSGTQTEPVATKDDSTQTDQATMVDEGSQTTTNETIDTGVGDDPINDDVDQGTQTESPTVKDDVSQTENKQQDDSTQTEVSTGQDDETQTDQPSAADKDSQTSDTSTTDTGVGDDSIGDVDQGTQTEIPTGKDENTQTESKQQSTGTQTESPLSKDEGTQIESNQVDKATQTETSTSQDTSTQTENSTEPSTSKDEGSQTDIIEKDTGIQEDHQITTTDDIGSNKGQINNATQPESSTVNTNDPNWQGDTPSWPISNTKAGSRIDTAEASSTLDPLAFHNELDQLQQPLKELATSPQTHESSSLPQTGNHEDSKVSILGTLTMLMGAFLTALHLRKRH